MVLDVRGGMGTGQERECVRVREGEGLLYCTCTTWSKFTS